MKYLNFPGVDIIRVLDDFSRGLFFGDYMIFVCNCSVGSKSHLENCDKVFVTDDTLVGDLYPYYRRLTIDFGADIFDFKLVKEGKVLIHDC